MDEAYLGENVVNEKEYLSAMVYVKAGICSRTASETDRGKGGLMEIKSLKKVKD